MNYVTTFLCGNYVCRLEFDGVVTFFSIWAPEVPKEMTGPMSASYEEACKKLCKEAFVPYEPQKFTNIYVKAIGPIDVSV